MIVIRYRLFPVAEDLLRYPTCAFYFIPAAFKLYNQMTQ